ncbi:hypothetical protein SLS58_002574 [Diplodia intermedia]|uniref:PilZ domain-containing protein n=1 Tax=Diplodia intermedia TaxID=856260 RepID=A0ABR3TYU9_9PEZI
MFTFRTVFYLWNLSCFRKGIHSWRVFFLLPKAKAQHFRNDTHKPLHCDLSHQYAEYRLMANFGTRPSSGQNNILFTVSAEGEIRSLKSPLPSPLKKRFPQQDLRQARLVAGSQKYLHTSSTSPPSDLTTPISPGTSNISNVGTKTPSAPPLQLSKLEIDVAIQIARSEYMQIGLQRRYWDPPLLPQHYRTAVDNPTIDADSFSRAVALTDISISGDPIRMCTPDFRVEPRGLKVGACLFLNLPYGANDACGLQVKMKDGSATDQPRFILEVCAAVVDAGDGRKAWRLCTQHDVTDMINDMARKRVASTAIASSSTSQHHHHHDPLTPKPSTGRASPKKSC